MQSILLVYRNRHLIMQLLSMILQILLCPELDMQQKRGGLCGKEIAVLDQNSSTKKLNSSKEQKESANASPAAGVKHDQQKMRWTLFPDNTLMTVLKVLEHGAKKYSPNNWMHVPSPEVRYYDAAMRHLEARKMGWYNDPESRLPHLAHAVCCLLFLLWFDIKKRKGHR